MSDTRVNREQARNFLKDHDADIAKKGYDFAAAFFSFWKSLKMYGDSNDTVLAAREKLFDIMKFFFRTQAQIIFSYNGVDLLINGQRLKGKRSAEDYLEILSTLFIGSYIGDITFTTNTTKEDVTHFCNLIKNTNLDKEGDENNFHNIEKTLLQRSSSITITMYEPIEDEMPPIIDKAQMARQMYRNLVLDFSQFQKQLHENRPVVLKKATRTIHNIVDLLTDKEEDNQWTHLLTLATLNAFQRNIIPTHAANTTILSIATALALGVEKKQLATIGLMSYFHDISLSDKDFDKNEAQHPEISFSYLSRLNSLNFAMMEAAIGARKHHDTFLFNGETTPPEEFSISTPLAEVIKVCDFYDISTRFWKNNPRKPYSRYQALDKLFQLGAKKCFIPAVVKGFFVVTGIYPPGTVMKIKGRSDFALSLGGFKNNYDTSTVITLDASMKFVREEVISPQLLTPLPAEQHFRVPPSTYKDILNNFQIT